MDLFWLLPGQLAGGSRPGTRRFPPGTSKRQLIDDLARLRNEGIGAILTLTTRPLAENWLPEGATSLPRHSEAAAEESPREALALEEGTPARPWHASQPPANASESRLVTLHLPIRDFTAPTPDQLTTAVAWIDQQLEAGRPTFVHCGGGRGRTGTILAAWLIAHGRTAADAVAEVRRVRPHAVETRGQRRALKAFAGQTRPSS